MSGMPMDDLSDIIFQMKELIELNEPQARQILKQNPVLTRAFMEAQLKLGIFPLPQSVPNDRGSATQEPPQSVQPVEQPNLGKGHQTFSAIAPSLASKQQQPPPPMLPASSTTQMSLPQSSQISILPSISPHIGSHSQSQPLSNQSPMPTKTTKLKKPKKTTRVPHLPLQFPQSRPQPSVSALAHQYYPQLSGIRHSGSPQMHHHLQPSSLKSPSSMGPSFRQAPLPSQSPYQVPNIQASATQRPPQVEQPVKQLNLGKGHQKVSTLAPSLARKQQPPPPMMPASSETNMSRCLLSCEISILPSNSPHIGSNSPSRPFSIQPRMPTNSTQLQQPVQTSGFPHFPLQLPKSRPIKPPMLTNSTKLQQPVQTSGLPHLPLQLPKSRPIQPSMPTNSIQLQQPKQTSGLPHLPLQTPKSRPIKPPMPTDSFQLKQQIKTSRLPHLPIQLPKSRPTQPSMPTNSTQLQQPMQTSILPHFPLQLPKSRPQPSEPAFAHQHHSGAPQMHHHLQPSSVKSSPSMGPSYKQAPLPSQPPYQIGNTSMDGKFDTLTGVGARPLVESDKMGAHTGVGARPLVESDKLGAQTGVGALPLVESDKMDTQMGVGAQPLVESDMLGTQMGVGPRPFVESDKTATQTVGAQPLVESDKMGTQIGVGARPLVESDKMGTQIGVGARPLDESDNMGTQTGVGGLPLVESDKMVSPPIISEMEKAFMHQIINLREEQLDLLPPHQRDQLFRLQQILLHHHPSMKAG